MKNNKFLIVLIIVGIVLALSLSGSYFLNGKSYLPTVSAQGKRSLSEADSTPTPTPASSPAQNSEIPFLPGVFSTDTSDSNLTPVERILNIFVRLLLAVILAGILAFRPRHNLPFFQRNLNVAQTQILLAVVAAALMIIVGDNTARAFAIFAAVSLVRFRTNIKDPKEITVLLISLALGLATGVGRWELGIFLCLFVLALLWILEYNESDQVFRSMELTVKTKNTDRIQEVLKRIFKKYRIEAEMRQITQPDEDEPIGCIMYYLNIRISTSTDQLSEQILASDAENIDGIEWKQQKSASLVGL